MLTKVTFSIITHHFGTREGSITELHALRVARARTRVITTGRTRGPVDAAVEPRAIPTLSQADALGMVEAHLDERPAATEDVVAVIMRAVGVFVTEPEPDERA